MVSPSGGVNSGKGCPAALAMFFISMTRPPSATPNLWRKKNSSEEMHMKRHFSNIIKQAVLYLLSL